MDNGEAPQVSWVYNHRTSLTFELPPEEILAKVGGN